MLVSEAERPDTDRPTLGGWEGERQSLSAQNVRTDAQQYSHFHSGSPYAAAYSEQLYILIKPLAKDILKLTSQFPFIHLKVNGELLLLSGLT